MLSLPIIKSAMSAFTFADKTILVIEDQRPFLFLLRGLLNSLGSPNVTTCPNAEQAISLCRKTPFDIIVCDLHLGNKRKNGFELVEELRVNKWIKPHAIFILISADSARPVVMGSIERRPDDFLIKPFSQAQLKSRIVRAWKKRQFLTPIFQASEKGQINQAIGIAKELMAEQSPYKRNCLQVLVELYWRTEQNENAMQILNADERGKSAMWTQIAIGKTQLAMHQYDNAIHTAHSLIKKNRFCVEAHDILAEAQSAQDNPEDALTTIQEALKISPYSLQRQFIACRIARESGDYELASSTCLSIWEQSKRTVHQSSSHWCSYIRSLLDVAENAEDKKRKNRFQQEALLAMQRSRFDDVLNRLGDDFDLSVFEELIHARINAIDGKLIEAKKLLAKTQFAIEQRFPDFPAVYAPDSIHTLLQIGEYEQGAALMNRLDQEGAKLDPNAVYAIEKAKADVKDKQSSYTELNKQGISLYQQGKFAEAKEIFQSAQKIVPVNTGVALNLLQCLLKLISQNEKKKPDPKHVGECRQVYKIIEGMPLVGQHKEKFDALSEELMEILQ